MWYSSALFQRLSARSFFYAQALFLFSDTAGITQSLFRIPQADHLLISTLLAVNLKFTGIKPDKLIFYLLNQQINLYLFIVNKIVYNLQHPEVRI